MALSKLNAVFRIERGLTRHAAKAVLELLPALSVVVGFVIERGELLTRRRRTFRRDVLVLGNLGLAPDAAIGILTVGCFA